MTGAKPSKPRQIGTVVTLKSVAQHLGLTPGTVSAVLNNTKAARTIPENTRKRIIEAARQLNYQPNFLARSLRVGHLALGLHIGSAPVALVKRSTELFATKVMPHLRPMFSDYEDVVWPKPLPASERTKPGQFTNGSGRGEAAA